MNKLGLSPEENEAVKQALKIAIEADVAAGAKRPTRRKVRPDIPIGWGDYDWPDWRNSRSIGRQYFLEAVAAVAPHVYSDLASTPFTLYRETPFLQDDDDRPFEFDENEFRHFLMGDPDPHYAPPDEFAPLIQGLRAWGTRYNLLDPWAQGAAFNKLAFWSASPEWAGKFHYSASTRIQHAMNLSDPALVFGDAPWEPTLYRWTEFIAKYPAYRRIPLENKKAYRAFVEELMIGRGLVPVKIKRTKEHWRWLARHRVLGMTYTEIAHQENSPTSDDRAVGKVVRDLAHLIGLTGY